MNSSRQQQGTQPPHDPTLSAGETCHIGCCVCSRTELDLKLSAHRQFQSRIPTHKSGPRSGHFPRVKFKTGQGSGRGRTCDSEKFYLRARARSVPSHAWAGHVTGGQLTSHVTGGRSVHVRTRWAAGPNLTSTRPVRAGPNNPEIGFKIFARNNSNKYRDEIFAVSKIVPCQVNLDFASHAASPPFRVRP